MADCDECGAYENLPYQCRRCGGTFCAEHRLPENHDCPGLNDWNDPGGVFDSGFDDSVADEGRSRGLTDRLPDVDSLTATGGALGYVRGNVAYLFLALMWVTFGLQFAVQGLFGGGVMRTLFVLQSDHLTHVWTWVTSIFAHGGLYHIAGNSIVLYFFGPVVERYVGSKRFAALFLASGVVAALGFVVASVALGGGGVSVVGASGAIFAVLGVLTVLNPKMRILLYFVIPIPLWLFTLGFALLSVFFFLSPGAAASAGQGNVAHFAHLLGLVVGLAYGRHIKGRQRVPDQFQFGGGPGGPGGLGPGRGRY
jgi:membrane associated rhomboid family serine protease